MNKISITLPKKVHHVQGVLRSMGLDFQVKQLALSTRTSDEAAAALNCTLGQIVKSLVFQAGDGSILVLVSGVNQVDEQILYRLIGKPCKLADAAFVRQHTGYTIGGVAPVGHPSPIPTYIDEDLLKYEKVWAAAGGPNAIFSCTPSFLADLGEIVRVN